MLAMRSSSWVRCFGLVIVRRSIVLDTVAKGLSSAGHASRSLREWASLGLPFWRRRGGSPPERASTGAGRSSRTLPASHAWTRQCSANDNRQFFGKSGGECREGSWEASQLFHAICSKRDLDLHAKKGLGLSDPNPESTHGFNRDCFLQKPKTFQCLSLSFDVSSLLKGGVLSGRDWAFFCATATEQAMRYVRASQLEPSWPRNSQSCFPWRKGWSRCSERIKDEQWFPYPQEQIDSTHEEKKEKDNWMTSDGVLLGIATCTIPSPSPRIMCPTFQT